MALEPIKLDIVAGGISQVRSAFKTVEQAASDMALRIQQQEQRNALKIKEINRKLADELDKLHKDEGKHHFENLEKKIAAEERANNQIKSINERAELAKRHMQEQTAANTIKLKEREAAAALKMQEREVAANARAAKQIAAIKERAELHNQHMQEREAIANARAAQSYQANWSRVLSSIGHLAQVSGQYRVGHLIRAASMLSSPNGSFVGTAVEGLGGAEGAGGAAGAAGAGLGTIAAVAVPVVLTLGALYVASKLVIGGLEDLYASGKYVAQQLASVFIKIGGAKNAEEMIVDAAQREENIKATRFVVSPEERLSEKELERRAEAISERPDLGGIPTSDVVKGQQKIGTLTGFQKSIDPQTLEFIAKMSHVGRVPFEQMAEVYGQVWAQNKSAPQSKIQEMFLSGMAIGQAGAFSIADIPHAKMLIQGGGMLAGSGLENTKNALAFGTILRPRTGDLETAGVQYEAFIRQAMLAHRQGQLSPELNKLFNKQGQITDINALVAGVVATPADKRAKPFNRAESAAFLSNIGRQAGIEGTDTTKQEVEKVRNLIDSYEKLHMSMEDFNKENEDSTSTSDRLRGAFNKISDRLEVALLPILEKVAPFIEAFASTIDTNSVLISTTISNLIDSFLTLIPVLIDVAKLEIFVEEVKIRAAQLFTKFIADSLAGTMLGAKFNDLSNSLGTAHAGLETMNTMLTNFSLSLPDLLAKLRQGFNAPPPAINSLNSLQNLYGLSNDKYSNLQSDTFKNAKQSLDNQFTDNGSKDLKDAASQLKDAAKSLQSKDSNPPPKTVNPRDPIGQSADGSFIY